MDEIAALGIRGITINASSIHDGHAPLIVHMENGVVTGIITIYMGSVVGRAVSKGVLKNPVVFHTHGSRPANLEDGRDHIDVAFIAAPTANSMGNFTGKIGKSACGSLGYAFADAECADKVVKITDNLVSNPLNTVAISETNVDYVVAVESIGDPGGIVSSTTRMPKDPVALRIAETAARAIDASGLLKDGVSFQSGAGSASLTTADFLKKYLRKSSMEARP